MSNHLEPVEKFVRDIVYTRDDHRFGGARYPNSYLSLDFVGLDSRSVGKVTAFKDLYDLADGNVRLWEETVFPKYTELMPHLKNLGEDGKRFEKWMKDSAEIHNTAALDLNEYRSRFQNVDQKTLNAIHYNKHYHGTYPNPLLDPNFSNLTVQKLLILEQRAAASSDLLHRRTLALFNASGLVYLGSKPRDIYFISPEAHTLSTTPPLATPQRKMTALVGCLGFLASAVPIALFMYQLSQTDDPLEVTKNFVKDVALSSLIPSFSAAMIYEGVRWLAS